MRTLLGVAIVAGAGLAAPPAPGHPTPTQDGVGSVEFVENELAFRVSLPAGWAKAPPEMLALVNTTVGSRMTPPVRYVAAYGSNGATLEYPYVLVQSDSIPAGSVDLDALVRRLPAISSVSLQRARKAFDDEIAEIEPGELIVDRDRGAVLFAHETVLENGRKVVGRSALFLRNDRIVAVHHYSFAEAAEDSASAFRAIVESVGFDDAPAPAEGRPRQAEAAPGVMIAVASFGVAAGICVLILAWMKLRAKASA